MFDAITRIHDVFEAWRDLGSKLLPNGTELIGRNSDGEYDGWMHAVFPRLDSERIDRIAAELGTELPVDLRRFYSACGGMILFGGLFRFFGLPMPRGLVYENGVAVDDVVSLNHQLDSFGWKPRGAIAVASSEWDASVFVAGMGDTPEQIVRVDRATGAELARIKSIWALVADKLYRLDEMFAR
jgi:hypothetical protein